MWHISLLTAFGQDFQKVSRLKQYLPRKKWTINEMLTFFKLVSLAFNTLIPVSFPSYFFSCFPYLENQQKLCRARCDEYGEYCTFTTLCFAKNQMLKNMQIDTLILLRNYKNKFVIKKSLNSVVEMSAVTTRIYNMCIHMITLFIYYSRCLLLNNYSDTYKPL